MIGDFIMKKGLIKTISLTSVFLMCGCNAKPNLKSPYKSHFQSFTFKVTACDTDLRRLNEKYRDSLTELRILRTYSEEYTRRKDSYVKYYSKGKTEVYDDYGFLRGYKDTNLFDCETDFYSKKEVVGVKTGNELPLKINRTIEEIWDYGKGVACKEKYDVMSYSRGPVQKTELDITSEEFAYNMFQEIGYVEPKGTCFYTKDVGFTWVYDMENRTEEVLNETTTKIVRVKEQRVMKFDLRFYLLSTSTYKEVYSNKNPDTEEFGKKEYLMNSIYNTREYDYSARSDTSSYDDSPRVFAWNSGDLEKF